MRNSDQFDLGTVNNRQHAAILAGLRLWQSRLEGTRAAFLTLDAIASCGGEETPLTADEIDDLCEQINTVPKP